MSRIFLGTAILLSMPLLVAGCGRGDGGNRDVQAEAQSVVEEPGWALTGQILRVNADRGAIIVHHDEIPGFMPEMTMEFKVGAGDLANAKEGSRIRARLVQHGEDFSLERIWPDDEATRQALAAGEAALAEGAREMSARLYPFRETGDRVPDFALYDQDGAVVEFSRFRGHRIVLNFIFTRCPFPSMCPASTTKMAGLQKSVKDAGVAGVHFLSISLDPAYDTPGVLKEYARQYGIGTANYSFLTGPETAVKNLLRQLGVTAFLEGGLVQHSLSTLLIDADGKIIHRSDGEEWDPEAFRSRLAAGP